MQPSDADGTTPRVLAREQARELTESEIDEVSGSGTRYGTPATCATETFGGSQLPDCDPPGIDIDF